MEVDYQESKNHDKLKVSLELPTYTLEQRKNRLNELLMLNASPKSTSQPDSR